TILRARAVAAVGHRFEPVPGTRETLAQWRATARGASAMVAEWAAVEEVRRPASRRPASRRLANRQLAQAEKIAIRSAEPARADRPRCGGARGEARRTGPLDRDSRGPTAPGTCPAGSAGRAVDRPRPARDPGSRSAPGRRAGTSPRRGTAPG